MKIIKILLYLKNKGKFSFHCLLKTLIRALEVIRVILTQSTKHEEEKFTSAPYYPSIHSFRLESKKNL